MECRKNTLRTRNSNDRLLVDSGFFFALFNTRDQHHNEASDKQEWLESLSIVIPWPILYETINTRFVRQPHNIARFESIINGTETEFLDDHRYRNEAYNSALALAKTRRNTMSLVDSILYAIIDDINVRIDAMLTFNSRDFSHVCRINRVELL